MEREQAWLRPAIAMAAAAVVCAATVNFMTGFPGHPSGLTSLTAAIAIVLVTALCRFLGYLLALWKAGNEHPIANIRAEFRPALLGFVPIAMGVAVLAAFLGSITLLKSMIPAVIPFWADAPFAAVDRALWVDPQAIAIVLEPALPALGLFYGLWHAVHLGSILWVLHWRQDNNSRYVLSFMLTWAIGMALAYIFSSAGPIFTGQYDPSVAPGSVRKAAEILLDNYRSQGALVGGGISAFPSMHVAIAAWFALVLREKGAWSLGLAYLIGVFACSIILGWHYVADSVAGIGVAILADRLSRAWLRGRRSGILLIPQPAAAPN